MTNTIQAKDCKCIVCGEQAEVFWPVIDPDIPSHPYCRPCAKNAQIRVMIELVEAEKKYSRYTSDCAKCGSRMKTDGVTDVPVECAYPEDCPTKRLNNERRNSE